MKKCITTKFKDSAGWNYFYCENTSKPINLKEVSSTSSKPENATCEVCVLLYLENPYLYQD